MTRRRRRRRHHRQGRPSPSSSFSGVPWWCIGAKTGVGGECGCSWVESFVLFGLVMIFLFVRCVAGFGGRGSEREKKKVRKTG